MDQLMGTIMLFAPNWTPRGWLPCDGRLLPIAQYSALFSLLTTQYGGDGVTNFALPKFNPVNTETPGAAVTLYIAVEGIYPSRAD